LQQVHPWIEPAQSFEKNQLGLSQMFFNSLRLTWQMSLWADSAVWLRTVACWIRRKIRRCWQVVSHSSWNLACPQKFGRKWKIAFSPMNLCFCILAFGTPSKNEIGNKKLAGQRPASCELLIYRRELIAIYSCA
jgi:hypothetical protein